MGTEYRNEVFEHICKFLGVEQKFSTAYHPETIGSLERNHRCLNEFLRQFINEKHDDWDTWLKYYVFCYNTTPHSVHQYTPFELIYGRQANIPQSMQNINIIEPVYDYDSYLAELKFKIQTAAKNTRELLKDNKANRINMQTTEANPIDIQVGNTVWLKIENRRKLDKVFAGPFEVLQIDHPNVKM